MLHEEEIAPVIKLGFREVLSVMLRTRMLGNADLIDVIDRISLVPTEPKFSRARHSRSPLVPMLEGIEFVRTQMPASDP